MIVKEIDQNNKSIGGGNRQYDVLSASFAIDILELGSPGFADWLVKTFGGPEPAHSPGRFHYDGDMLFHEAMRFAAREFSEDVAQVARQGAKLALDQFDRESGTYAGLLEVACTAEALDCPEWLSSVGGLLYNWVPSRNMAGKTVASLNDVLALREILECIFRRFWIDCRNGDCGEYRRILRWAHSLVGEQAPQDWLIPALAPLYILARAHLQLDDKLTVEQKKGKLKIIERWLKNGALYSNGKFQTAYVFNSSRNPVGLFPYNLDDLLLLGDKLDHFLGVEAQKKGKAARLRKLIRTDDPFQRAQFSATSGMVLNESSQNQYAEEMNRELEEA